MKIHRSDKLISAFVLIFIAVGVYVYFFQKPIEKKDLIIVEGELFATPEIIDQSEGLQYYAIRWQLKGNDKEFYLRDCAFETANRDSILSLSAATTVKMWVLGNEYENEKTINVYSLIVRKNESFLDLDEFNQCYANYWKRLLPLIILVAGILVYSIYFLNRRNLMLKKFNQINVLFWYQQNERSGI